MSKSVLSRAQMSARAAPVSPRQAATVSRRPRQRARAAGVATLVLVGAGTAGWWWYHRVARAPAIPAVTALHPTEARLLAMAAREPANPGPFLDLAEEYAASTRP